MELFIGLVVFSFVSSITPGPNNLMLMNSGADYGVKKTLPHLFGVTIGFTIMVFLVGIGVMNLFERFPVIYTVLKVLCILYLLYLAYKIAQSSELTNNQESGKKPFTFLQAALFQWVNPKAWTMALTAISLYATTESIISVLLTAIIFGLVNLPCVFSWVKLGEKLQRFLKNPKRLKVFNITMACLLVISIIPAL